MRTRRQRAIENSSSNTRRLPNDAGKSADAGIGFESTDETINEDDLCPICQVLLHDPVTTQCNHTLCKSCMAIWAEVSIGRTMKIVSVNEQPADFDPVTDLEAKCPMCRTSTSASLDERRARDLQSRYPQTYAQRQAEEASDGADRASTQTITVYIGNRHRLVEPPNADEQSANQHEWTFFIRPSRTEIVEEVHIFLHPTFRQNHIIRSRPPYEVQRLGWGYFTITTDMILKPGYSWISSDAQDSPDGAEKGMLRLLWMLDFQSFDGTGAMARYRLKVQNDRDWEQVSDEGERDEREWNRMIRSYQRDRNYEPPSE